MTETDDTLDWEPGVTASPNEVQNTTFAHAHTDLILALPEPGEPYLWSELVERVPEFGDDHTTYLQRLQNHNAIRKHNQEYHNETLYTVWVTNESLYNYCKHLANNRPSGLPCGHRSGFRTVDAEAGRYECGAGWCDARYGRETIKRVFK